MIFVIIIIVTILSTIDKMFNTFIGTLLKTTLAKKKT